MKNTIKDDEYRYPDKPIKGEDNTQADNAVADVFFFSPSPNGDKEIKVAKLSFSVPNNVKKVKLQLNAEIEVVYEGKEKLVSKVSISNPNDCCWVWDFGDA